MASMPGSPEGPNGVNDIDPNAAYNSMTGVEAERSVAGRQQHANAGYPQDRIQDEQPVTLLQLVDGPMYGLTDYWIEGDQLHYITTYGGQNAVPILRIDFEKTAKLNADQGVEFVLRPKSSLH